MSSKGKEKTPTKATADPLKQDLASFFKLGTVVPKVYDKVLDPEDNDGYVLPKGVTEAGIASMKDKKMSNDEKLKMAHARLKEIRDKKRRRDTTEEDVEEKYEKDRRAKRPKKREEEDENSSQESDANSEAEDMVVSDLEDSLDGRDNGSSSDDGENGEEGEAKEEETKELTEEEKKALKKRLSRQASRHRRAEAKAKEKAEREQMERETGEKLKKNRKMTEAEKEEVEARTLFVGNVPINVDKKDVEKLFSQYGRVLSVRFRNMTVMNPDNRLKSVIKGDFHPERDSIVAYVVFDSEACIKPALKANGIELGGKHLRVDSAKKSQLSRKDYENCVYISHLPFAAEEEDLREIFSRCGTIASIRIIRDNHYKVAKGFGYVRFSSREGFEAAIKLNRKITYKDNVLTLIKALPPKGTLEAEKPARRNAPRSLSQKFKSKSKSFAAKKRS
jgi:nucleolar protein 12